MGYRFASELVVDDSRRLIDRRRRTGFRKADPDLAAGVVSPTPKTTHVINGTRVVSTQRNGVDGNLRNAALFGAGVAASATVTTLRCRVECIDSDVMCLCSDIVGSNIRTSVEAGTSVRAGRAFASALRGIDAIPTTGSFTTGFAFTADPADTRGVETEPDFPNLVFDESRLRANGCEYGVVRQEIGQHEKAFLRVVVGLDRNETVRQREIEFRTLVVKCGSIQPQEPHANLICPRLQHSIRFETDQGLGGVVGTANQYEEQDTRSHSMKHTRAGSDW